MILFTIGYEGKSIEEYLEVLRHNMVDLVIDVRRNPVSRKYGFSKNRMRAVLQAEGIGYVHYPQLGIESSRRKGLSKETDYMALLSWYEDEVLPKEQETLSEIIIILHESRRVALTCYEADHNCCHRSRVSSRLAEIAEPDLDLVHL